MKTEEKDKEYLGNLRHSCAHLLAAAVMELWPKAKRTIGPAIENGFYFDFDFGDTKISEDDLRKIEVKMHELVKEWCAFKEIKLTKAESINEYPDNGYKHELIEEFSKGDELLSFYESVNKDGKGLYKDLCKGGHIEKPDKELKHFKLLSVAGAYWRGSEKNKMLTRIYGTAFPSQKELTDYLESVEEAKKRDHRKLAKELDLIVFSEIVGGGLPLYTPKGALVRSLMFNFSRELNKKIGYTETALPSVNRAELFKISGHYDKYREDMFLVKSHYSEEEYYLKPMNCPQHCVLFGSKTRSYKDLPIRYSDFSVLYRDERPGEINGLFRSRSFTQDDGHCFCTEDQVEGEFANVMDAVDEALKGYGFGNYWIRLSLRDPNHPEKYLGDEGVWKRAEARLEKIVKSKAVKYVEGLGEAAIYGPKLDFMVKDSLNREWQISTVQLDMIMAKRFGLSYSDEKGKQVTPLMVHRAIIGSERFMAILIEHFSGAFPLWLSPIQVKVLPITDRNTAYANKLGEDMKNQNLRVEVDERSQTLGAKIRDAQAEKVPYLLVVGDREVAENKVAVRVRSGKDVGNMDIAKFIKYVKNKEETKSLEL